MVWAKHFPGPNRGFGISCNVIPRIQPTHLQFLYRVHTRIVSPVRVPTRPIFKASLANTCFPVYIHHDSREDAASPALRRKARHHASTVLLDLPGTQGSGFSVAS